MRNKEKSIAHSMQYCQHYDPNALFMIGGKEATGLCKAGVKVREVFGDAAGIVHRMPCIHGKVDGSNNAELIARCSKWLQVTREMGEKRFQDIEESIERSIERHRKIAPMLAKWRTWTRANPVAKQERVNCPACGGLETLFLSQAAYNGHVWGKCSTSGCVSWME